MKNAKELMLEYTAFSFREPKKAAEMFAEDGAFELPVSCDVRTSYRVQRPRRDRRLFPIRARYLSQLPIRDIPRC